MDARIETHATPSGGRSRFPKSVLLVGLAIAALIAVAVVIALAAPREPTAYPAGSPEAAFQDYYQAWEADDIEAAYGHLSAGIQKDVDLNTYRRLDSEQSWQRQQDRRLVLQGVDVTADRAVLHLRVDESYGGGIGRQRTSFERSVRLVRENGTWLIDEPLVGIESVTHAL